MVAGWDPKGCDPGGASAQMHGAGGGGLKRAAPWAEDTGLPPGQSKWPRQDSNVAAYGSWQDSSSSGYGGSGGKSWSPSWDGGKGGSSGKPTWGGVSGGYAEGDSSSWGPVGSAADAASWGKGGQGPNASQMWAPHAGGANSQAWEQGGGSNSQAWGPSSEPAGGAGGQWGAGSSSSPGTAPIPVTQPEIPPECQQWLQSSFPVPPSRAAAALPAAASAAIQPWQQNAAAPCQQQSPQETQGWNATSGKSWDQMWPAAPGSASIADSSGHQAAAAAEQQWSATGGADSMQPWAEWNEGAGEEDWKEFEQVRQQWQLLQTIQVAKPGKSNPFHGTNVIPTQSQEDQLNQNEGKRFLGRIKRFFGGKASGYGFIDCPEARARYGYDVYLHAKQMHGCEVGEFVSFTIVRNAKGEPQARNLVRAVEAAHVEAKRQQEIIKQQEMLLAKRGGSLYAPVAAGGGGGGAVEMDEEAAKRFQQTLKSQRR